MRQAASRDPWLGRRRLKQLQEANMPFRKHIDEIQKHGLERVVGCLSSRNVEDSVAQHFQLVLLMRTHRNLRRVHDDRHELLVLTQAFKVDALESLRENE